MSDTALHFEEMSKQFTIEAKDGVRAEFSVPDNIMEDRLISGYLREIESLNVRLRKNED